MTTIRSARGSGSVETTDGLAPAGMLWVAWRQRRSLILITLGLYAATAVTIVVRSLLRARDLASAGVVDLATCTDPGMTTTALGSCERWLTARDSWSTMDSQINSAPAVICVLFGLGLGAAAVGHELERGLGTFSFTQSISLIRWAATQLGVIVATSVTGAVVLDGIIRTFVDGNPLVDGSGSTSLWPRPLLIVAMICLAFALSIVSGGSSGGFWGGLGFLVVGGIVLNLLTGSTASSSQSDALTCPSDDGELCGRISLVVFQFRALFADTAVRATPIWAISLTAVGIAGLLGGFLLLRRWFR